MNNAFSAVSVLVAITLVATLSTHALDSSRSLTQHGITWTFDREVQYGKFVNGDYYIVDGGQGIKIDNVTPRAEQGRNGSMIDPVVGGQAYDSRAGGYVGSLNVGFPLTIRAGQSLVSAVSVGDEDVDDRGFVKPSWGGARVSLEHARLKSAAVLTVVGSPPAPDSFRPAYLAGPKTLHSLGKVDRTLLLGLPSPKSLPDIRFHERALERPWIGHTKDYLARAIHPTENMPNYHREVGECLGIASLLLLTDSITERLLIGYIQNAIDSYQMAVGGAGDSAFYDWNVIYSGWLLGDRDMIMLFLERRSKTPCRAEEHFYYWNEAKSTLRSSIVSPGKTWTGATVFFRKGIGMSEHEHLHPTEWDRVANGGGAKQESYRQCCDSLPNLGLALAAKITGGRPLLAKPAVVDYLNRWMTEPFGELLKVAAPGLLDRTGDSTRKLGSDFEDQMWIQYGTMERRMEAPGGTGQLRIQGK